MAQPSSYDFDFTDGDTYKRATISLAGFAPLNVNSRVFVSVQRHLGADVNDPGWSFSANSANLDPVGQTIDLAVWANALDAGADPGEFPNERVTVNYWVV